MSKWWVALHSAQGVSEVECLAQHYLKLKMKIILPSSSSSSPSASSAFLSLSCMITCLAMEAKVRLTGVVEEVAGGMVKAAMEEDKAESVGLSRARLDDVEEAHESLDKDGGLGIWAEEWWGNTHVFSSESGEDGFVGTVLDVGWEDTAGDSDSKEVWESAGAETVWGNGWVG